MKKYLIYVFLLAFCSLVSCECEIRSAINPKDGNNRVDNTKITSLQYVIDHCSMNDTIDLSNKKFKTITDYKATVNKSVTIKKGDLKGETLTITSDGVTLENLTNVSVVGNASTKIANSSLKDLKIGSTSSRGTSNKIARPVVEIIKTNIREDIAINLEESIVIATNSSAKNLCFNANNTQVDICDKNTKFENIKTDKICKLVLEDGTSDTIPLPTVNGDGELTQVNVKAANSKKLQKLTVASGLYTVISDEEYPNFESLVVLGTYTADDGITIFKPNGLSYEMAQTFSRYEKDFTVKIEDDDYFINGIQQKFDRLSIGSHPCKISSNFPNRAGNYEFTFTLTVVGEKQAKLTPTLTKITVDSSMMKTQYAVNQTFDTTGLLVFGEYKLGEISYQAVIRDFDISPRNGALLNVEDTKATVSFGGKTEEFDISVEVGCKVEYQIDVTNDVKIVEYVKKGDTVNQIKLLKYQGKILESWSIDTTSPINEDKEIKPNWQSQPMPDSYTITYKNLNGANNSSNPTSFTVNDNITLQDISLTGYTFNGWYDAENDGNKVTGWTAGNKTGNVTVWARWIGIEYNIIYKDCDNQNFTGNWKSSFPNKHIYGSETILVAPNKTNYDFEGWHKQANCFDTGITSIGANEITSDITLYAKWSLHNYTITYYNTQGAMNPNVTSFTVNDNITLQDISLTGYTFNGWYDASSDGNIISGWNQNEKNYDVVLWARWTTKENNISFGGKEYKKTALVTVLSTKQYIPKDQTQGAFSGNGSPTEGIDSYEIGKYPVTVELFYAVMGYNPNTFVMDADKRDNYEETNILLRPISNINWYEAVVFCNKLSKKMNVTPCYTITENSSAVDWENLQQNQIPTTNETWNVEQQINDGYRLPTAPEWECAARGGQYSTTMPWTYNYSGGNDIAKLGWTTEDKTNGHPWEVGLKNANTLGLYDMSGNVLEWCFTYVFDFNNNVSHVLYGGWYCCNSNDSPKVNCQAIYKEVTSFPQIGMRLARSIIKK